MLDHLRKHNRIEFAIAIGNGLLVEITKLDLNIQFLPKFSPILGKKIDASNLVACLAQNSGEGAWGCANFEDASWCCWQGSEQGSKTVAMQAKIGWFGLVGHRVPIVFNKLI